MQRKNKILFLLGLFLLNMSIILIALKTYINLNYLDLNKKMVTNYMEFTSLSDNISNQSNQNEKYEIAAVLEIPDLNLRRVLTYDDVYNDIKYNVQIISGKMPDNDKNNLILAAHSGNGQASFFSKLSMLTDESEIYIYYNGIKYVYRIFDYYEVTKSNQILVKRNREFNTLTLITCSEIDNNKQIIYISYLVDKIAY